ncbi:MAG: enoyl-CoA hydratase-related protein [Gammaproteobacteria bacterium]|nr:enoyl-CoA hydratase-related protein [Gammaproteobacteria bacterium]
MELKVVSYQRERALAIITLSRPQRRNAWTGRMHAEYRGCLAQADADPAVRVIIVTGNPEGQAFCVGADLGGLEKMSEQGEYDAGITEDISRPGYGVHPAFDATFAYHFGLSKPIIAAINGAAAGVGLVLAAFCDLRFAVQGAKFTAAHGRFNFPVEYGLSWILPRLIGITHANDLLLSSRVFTAEEAMEMGFLNKVLAADELLDHVCAYAQTMADTVSPGSLRETRRQIYTDQHRSLAEAVEDSERLIREMARHPDYAEGVSAWMEKRVPEWSGDR